MLTRADADATAADGRRANGRPRASALSLRPAASAWRLQPEPAKLRQKLPCGAVTDHGSRGGRTARGEDGRDSAGRIGTTRHEKRQTAPLHTGTAPRRPQLASVALLVVVSAIARLVVPTDAATYRLSSLSTTTTYAKKAMPMPADWLSHGR